MLNVKAAKDICHAMCIMDRYNEANGKHCPLVREFVYTFCCDEDKAGIRDVDAMTYPMLKDTVTLVVHRSWITNHRLIKAAMEVCEQAPSQIERIRWASYMSNIPQSLFWCYTAQLAAKQFWMRHEYDRSYPFYYALEFCPVVKFPPKAGSAWSQVVEKWTKEARVQAATEVIMDKQRNNTLRFPPFPPHVVRMAELDMRARGWIL